MLLFVYCVTSDDEINDSMIYIKCVFFPLSVYHYRSSPLCTNSGLKLLPESITPITEIEMRRVNWT